MYTLYIANKNYSSWSLRPWVLMRELAIPFQEKLIPFDSEAGNPKFHAVSPTGRLPCLHDGGVVVWDSLAITEYLAERHPRCWPAEPRARAWARSAVAEMHAGFPELRTRCPMNICLRVRLHEVPPALTAELGRLCQLWTEALQLFGGPFLGGREFSAADAFFAPMAFRIQTYGLELPEQPAAYVRRLLGVGALIAWRGDAFRERWQDEAHEQDVRRRGTIIEDRRARP